MTAEEIKDFIRARMKQEKMYTPELSRLSGISKETIYNWMNGRNHLNVLTLIDICDALGLELVISEKGGAE